MKNLSIGDVGLSTVVESLRGADVVRRVPAAAAHREVLEVGARVARATLRRPRTGRRLPGFPHLCRAHAPAHDPGRHLHRRRQGTRRPQVLPPAPHAVARNLRAAGIAPEQVDFVMCTHMHADHVGWNTRLVDGRWVPTFPRARYLFARTEYEHRRRNWEAAAGAGYGAFDDSILPVVESGQAVIVDDGHELDGCLKLEPAPGHTPGNVVIHLQSRGERGVFAGDVLHHPIQVAHPEWSAVFCEDRVQSAPTRQQLRRHACRHGHARAARAFPRAHRRAHPLARRSLALRFRRLNAAAVRRSRRMRRRGAAPRRPQGGARRAARARQAGTADRRVLAPRAARSLSRPDDHHRADPAPTAAGRRPGTTFCGAADRAGVRRLPRAGVRRRAARRHAAGRTCA